MKPENEADPIDPQTADMVIEKYWEKTATPLIRKQKQQSTQQPEREVTPCEQQNGLF